MREGLVARDKVQYVERSVPEWGNGGESRGVCNEISGEGKFQGGVEV